jgi:pimeloyl-ACP methyl ester carboxylesterase
MMKIILISIVFLYLIITAGFYFLQDKFIFFPQKIPDGSRSSIKYQNSEITLYVDGVALHGWLLNKEEKQLIIYYGGNAEEVSCSIDDFEGLKNYSILLMNYRGYGKSGGSPSEKQLFSDALEIFDSITNMLDIQPENRVLFGRSLGSGIALYVASMRKVSSVILVTPFDSIRNIIRDKIPIIPVDILLKHPFHSLSYAKDVTCPSLVIIAQNDRVIKNKYSINLVKNMGGDCEHFFIENAEHNDVHTYPEYWSLITNHLNE